MKTSIRNKFLLTASAAVFTTTFAQSQTLLFRDDFTRANNTDLNASDAGQSGALSPLDWVEINCGTGIAEINGNQLRIDDGGSGDGGAGAVVYPDKNFTGLTSLTVTMDIDSGGSGGDGRATCFGIGYTKSALDAKTSASSGVLDDGSDVFIGYDTIGGTKSFFVRENGTGVFSKPIPTPNYPVEYKVVFTFADMNDGTTINYEVFENGLSVHNDTTTWTGTDENYIGFGSNYTGNTDLDFIQIEGTLLPPANIVKADNTDNLNLGNSWVGGFAPASGELAVWDSTVTGPNSTVLGADLTWGGINIQNPAGVVTIGGANTLTLDGLESAIDLSTATADLTINANLALAGSEIWTVASGRTVTVAGAVSGIKGIDKQGDGTVVLSGANTYTGATSATTGTLQLGAADAIPNGLGAGNVSVEGSIDLNGFSDTINGLTGGGVIDNAANSTTATLTAGDNDQSGTFSGILQNSGASATLNFVKTGAGTINLGAAHTLSGTVTVAGGKLAFTDTNPFGNASGIVMDDGTTIEPRVNAGTLSSPVTLSGGTSTINAPAIGTTSALFTLNLASQISGAGGLTFQGVQGSNTRGTVILGAANTYSGDTLLTTDANNSNKNIFVTLGAENALPVTTVVTLDGQNGTGTSPGRGAVIDLNGKNQTLAGLTNIPRNLRYQRVINTSTDTSAILTINDSVDYTFSGSIGVGTDTDISLTKTGTAVFTLSGNNGYTGSTLVNGGELQLGDGGTGGAISSSSSIAVASGATFGINQSDAVAQGTEFSSNPLTGDGNFAQRGTGSTTLNVANTYNGTTTVDAGALVVEHAEALGSTAAGTVVNGTSTSNSANARLDLSGGVTVTGESLTISGTGNFLGALTSSSGSNVWAGPVTIGAAGTRLGTSAGASLEVSGVIDSGAVDTGLLIRSTDLTASVILSGANTYLGTTQVVIGKLQLAGGDNRLPVGTNLLLSNSASNPGAELDLNGTNQEIAGMEISGSADPTKNAVNNSSGTPSTLTVNTPTAAPSTYAGILTGNLAITKTGPDTLSLTGTNNVYTGDTTVNEGILSLSGINPSNESSTVTIAASGATLDLAFAGTDTVDKLIIGTTQMAAGVYGPSATPLAQITGTGTLTVTSGPSGGGYGSWASLNGAGPNLDDDHDGDGVSNGIEYFIGGPNGNTTGFTALPGVSNDSGTLSVTFTKAADYTGVYGTDFVVETSATLASPWTAETADPAPGFTVTFPTATEVKYTFPAGTKDFARLKVTGP